jgi:two-component system, OmpR family, sensor histidine kinase BaeS
MRSIAARLTLAFLFIGLTGAVLMAIILQIRARTAFDEFILSRDQQSLVDSLLNYYQTTGSWAGISNDNGFGPPTSSRSPMMRPDNRRSTTHYTLIDTNHTVKYSNFRNQANPVVSDQELKQAIPLKVNQEIIGWLILSPFPSQWGPNTPERIFLDNINRATLLSALGAIALALAVGGLLALTLTKSIREMTEVTHEIARGKFGRQVKVRSKDELGELASSFNKMSIDLEKATESRKQMTADIAHDLRTPLSIISGYAEALSDNKLPGSPEIYKILYQETQHLSRLVDDLRTLTQADSGELALILQPTSPSELLGRVLARHAVAAQQKGVSLKLDIDENLPLINIDPERISQVLDNLINNAFRYLSPQGTIMLSARKTEPFLSVQVRDNGSGIAVDDLPHIFDRFYRGDPSRQQNGESGLGLAIAKSIVEAHGGRISAESHPGNGTVFTINLPLSIY